MKKDKNYYCGYEDSPEWIRKFMSSKFNASCKIHDLDYNSDSQYYREKADVRFRDHMLRQAGKNLFWITVAYLYYLAVIWGGNRAFRGKIKKK